MFDTSGGIDELRFREVLGHFASGLTVVTAMEDDGPVGFTCQSFSALSLDPPLIVLAAAKTSTSWPKVVKAGFFCVNILMAGQEALGRSFAASGTNKFAGVPWTTAATGAPVLEGVLAFIDCSLVDIHDAGDHELVTGRVIEVGTGQGEPLIFYRGQFGGFSG